VWEASFLTEKYGRKAFSPTTARDKLLLSSCHDRAVAIRLFHDKLTSHVSNGIEIWLVLIFLRVFGPQKKSKNLLYLTTATIFFLSRLFFAADIFLEIFPVGDSLWPAGFFGCSFRLPQTFHRF
jgi:hypothetical protein